MTLEQWIAEPFTQDLSPLEPLRQLVLSYAHTDPTKAPAGVVWRAMQTDLRSLFPQPEPGTTPPEFVPESGNTQAFHYAVKQYGPVLNKVEAAAIKAGVPLEQQVLIRRYVEHWLPHNQISGLCALVTLCAMRRDKW